MTDLKSGSLRELIETGVLGEAAKQAHEHYQPQIDECIREINELRSYAEQVSAPARELLELYDWRPKLAELEKCDMETWGKLQSDTKTYLRQYGERKKAGWIALRAALAKNPNPAGPSVSAEAFGGSPLPSSQGDVLSAEASGAGGAGTRWCCEGVPCQHLGWCNSDYCAALDPKRDSRTQSGTNHEWAAPVLPKADRQCARCGCAESSVNAERSCTRAQVRNEVDAAHEARQIWISITGNGEGLWREFDRQAIATLERNIRALTSRTVAGTQRPEPTACGHKGAAVEFDPVAAKGLSDREIRRRWPRFDGACPDCGARLIKYASQEHYVMGDW